MKELNEMELREVEGGCPWLGVGLFIFLTVLWLGSPQKPPCWPR